MLNTHKTTKNSVLGIIIALVFAVTPSAAFASDYGFGADDWFSGDSYSFAPVYDQYTPSYDSYSFAPVYDQYYPSYDSYSFAPVYDQYYPSSDYGYNWGSSDYSGYSYQPYSYGSYGGYGGGYTYTPSAGYDYIYNTNANVNTNNNTNTNTITNTFNPTNNNDARINLVVYGGGTGTTNTQSNLDGNCTISPSVVYVNQDVSFSASATGGTSGYTYSWTGDNGVNSSSQSFTGRYSYPGMKTATVTIRSGSQTITRSCNVEVRDTYNGNIGAYCVANPTNAVVGQNVTWTVYPTYNNNYNYNNGSYYGNTSYSWTGTDNLYGNGQTIVRSYNTPGYKTATVTGFVNGQSFTTSCSTNIVGVQSNVTVIRDQNLGTPVSGVFLSQVPETGISFGLKMTLFTLGLVLWSIFAAYMIARKKGIKAADMPAEFMSKVNAFKLNNMKNKGII